MIETALAIPIRENPNREEGDEGAFAYFNKDEEAYIMSTKHGCKVFIPSYDLNDSWMIVARMKVAMSEMKTFLWNGPLIGMTGHMKPHGGRFIDDCYFIYIVYAGHPILTTSDTPHIAICKGGLIVKVMSDDFGEQLEKKGKNRIKKIR